MGLHRFIITATRIHRLRHHHAYINSNSHYFLCSKTHSLLKPPTRSQHRLITSPKCSTTEINTSRHLFTNAILTDNDRQSDTTTQPATSTDEFYMRIALQEAQKAADAGEIPVGAIIIDPTGNIIAQSHNKTEQANDPTAHAEMLCLREASQKRGGWRLHELTMYVTLEPCGMCAGALLQSRVKRVVYGARNSLLGADGSWIDMLNSSGSYDSDMDEYSISGDHSSSKDIHNNNNNSDDDGDDTTSIGEYRRAVRPVKPHPFHPNIIIKRGVLADECSEIMKKFFQMRRLEQQQMDGTALS